MLQVECARTRSTHIIISYQLRGLASRSSPPIAKAHSTSPAITGVRLALLCPAKKREVASIPRLRGNITYFQRFPGKSSTPNLVVNTATKVGQAKLYSPPKLLNSPTALGSFWK